MAEPPTYVKKGHKRKWQRKKGIRHWNDHVEKVINDKEKPSRNFYQQVKQKIKLTVHTKEQYQNKRFIKTIETAGKHLYLTDVT
jgi:hypothetical protein